MRSPRARRCISRTHVAATTSWIASVTIRRPSEPQHGRFLVATLHALRDRLTIDEVTQLAAQLPMLIRGLYYEGWDPSIRPLKDRHLEEFLARIQQELRGDEDLDPEEVARAVFDVMRLRVTEGEIEDVRHMLPSKIRELWPAPEHAHTV